MAEVVRLVIQSVWKCNTVWCCPRARLTSHLKQPELLIQQVWELPLPSTLPPKALDVLPLVHAASPRSVALNVSMNLCSSTRLHMALLLGCFSFTVILIHFCNA